jgi:hypothetical protein
VPKAWILAIRHINFLAPSLVRLHVCMPVCLYAGLPVWLYAYMFVWLYVCILYACKFVCLHSCIFVCVCLSSCCDAGRDVNCDSGITGNGRLVCIRKTASTTPMVAQRNTFFAKTSMNFLRLIRMFFRLSQTTTHYLLGHGAQTWPQALPKLSLEWFMQHIPC